MSFLHFVSHLLGFDFALPYGHFGWYNAWSGFLGTGLIGSLGVLFHRKMNRHHAERLAQAANHHREDMEQASQQHEALMAQAAASPDARQIDVNVSGVYDAGQLVPALQQAMKAPEAGGEHGDGH